ncbi:transcriptional coactivator p15/PC4 family protein [Xanthobacter sediminis]
MADRHIATIRKNAREEIRVSLGEYNGHQLFSARVWFEADDGSMRPSKAGLAFRVDRLPDFAEAVQAALKAQEDGQ